MDENTQLQARIAALSGIIAQRKQSQQKPSPPAATFQHQYSHAPQPYRGSHRWAPYGRGGRGGNVTAHKNRTLVLNGTQSAASPDTLKGAVLDTSMSDAPSAVISPKPAFVSTRRAGTNQLMTKDIFEREQKQKQKQTQQQPVAKATPTPRPVAPQKPRGKPANAVPQALRELEIGGIRFQMLHDGSKLIRVPGESESEPASKAFSKLSGADAATQPMETPKTYKIADVEFFRTKHGNLVRANRNPDNGRPVKRAHKPQCEHFANNGTCPFGPSCRFSHDPTMIAICKEFLRTGSCSAGKGCDLSHDATYHRVPACAHFLRGNCTNPACRYPHVRVSPAAPVCRPFATLGYCSKGPDCDKRHVHECPAYSNHGRCEKREKGTCSLPHVDHASTLRKAAQRQARAGNEEDSDVTSDEDEAEEDYDSDEIDSDVEVFTGSDDAGHELSQQRDFLPLF